MAMPNSTSALFLLAIVASIAFAGSSPAPAASEGTDVYIRRLAGLPASSAVGEIAIVDVGHMPMSKMLSIVAQKTPNGWRVSYACAASPHCSPAQDHLAKEYGLSILAGERVDAILAHLRTGFEPDGTPPGSNAMACGRLAVTINYQGFNRTYYRACAWGSLLGELETLLKAPAD